MVEDDDAYQGVGWEDPKVIKWWQEGFTAGADPEYVEQMLPLAAAHVAGARVPAAAVLDIGCGEGQVARYVAAYLAGAAETDHAGAGAGRGTPMVVGVDPSWAQAQEVRARGGGVAPALAVAGALPFPTESFDTVVVCLVFEHIDDAEGALAEVARVLRPGGRFVFLLNHPLLQTPGSGWVDDPDLGGQYWRVGPYLAQDHSLEEVDDNIWLPYVHRPLSTIVNTLSDNGLLISRMEEPEPPAGFLAEAEEDYPDAALIPRLMLLVADKLAPEPAAKPANKSRW